MAVAASTKPRVRVKAGRHRGLPMAMGGAFDAASRSAPELAGWEVTSGSADRDLMGERPIVAARARDLARNDALIAGAIESKKDRIVGGGLKLQSMPDRLTLDLTPDEARAKSAEIERLWAEWSEDCVCADVRAERGFGDLTRLAAEQDLIEGESFALCLWQPERQALMGSRFATVLQIIDPARVANPLGRPDDDSMRQGVEIDGFGAPVAYHVLPTHPGDGFFLRGAPDLAGRRIARFGPAGRPQVIHSMDIRRPGQHRGISALAPVVRDLKMRGRYARAELQAAVVNAVIAAVVETPLDGASIAELFGDAEKFISHLDQSEGISLGVSPGGLVPELPPGQKVSTFSTDRPNAGFADFMRATALHLAVGLNETPETLLRDFSQTNFSSARASLAEAWRGILTFRTRKATYFCRPVLEALLLESVARGYIDLPGFVESRRMRSAWLRGAWLGPARGWIDPEKEIVAAAMAIAIGLSTLHDEAMALGKDPDQLLEQIAAERAALAELGIVLPQVRVLTGLANPGDVATGAERMTA